ncbi:MAG: endonuclease MutS2, partial [Chloroflexi bacterium]|nr:endonuclease MutS2 [Chloroflexota bacterium]
MEFPKILEQLAGHTTFSAGRELALALQPTSDPAAIALAQQETREALYLFNARASVPLGGAHDVRPLVANARIGATLQPADMLDLRDTLSRSRAVRRTLLRLAAEVPRLAVIAARLMDESHAADEISRCINDRAEVVDAASPALQKIRRELNVAHARLMDRLQRMISSTEFGKFIQEPIITQRSGRYVIPLKSDFKGRVPGLVHDQSASGATLFIEPLATVEMNNALRELQLQEQREIERILTELTAFVAAEGDRIVWAVESLADLDLAFAKALYAEALRAHEPAMGTNDGGQTMADEAPPLTLNLINARHPLLNPQTVVPISLALDSGARILIITGPNTGGKTVTLKTVGLLALMAQAGLFIPADEGSALPVFENVFADIGDEQSIEQSLSTFSSHMRNVIEFLREADPRSLVLMDELGAGTDPVEGSALAQAVLEHLRARGIMALVATHYTELK